MIKSNFLFNVDSRIRWESGEVGNIQLLVKASSEAKAKKIAEEELMNKEHWRVKEHHYLLSDKINSTDYGMFTVGIEQVIAELKAEVSE